MAMKEENLWENSLYLMLVLRALSSSQKTLKHSISELPKPREEQIPGKSMGKTLFEEVAVFISMCGSKSMGCADQRRFLHALRGFLTKDVGLMSHSLRNPLQGISRQFAMRALQALPLASRFCGVIGMHTERWPQKFPSKELH